MRSLRPEIATEKPQTLAARCGVKHVGIIMDGNGRWATQRELPRLEGHHAGADTVDRIVEASRQMGLDALTLYTFSTENWRRPEDEVEGLFELLHKSLIQQAEKLDKNQIRFCTIGDTSLLPSVLRSLIRALEEQTAHHREMTLTLALNYGGRDEIVRTVRELATQVKEGQLEVEDIDEERVTEQLDTWRIAQLPDPEIIIRTGGELRLSNFLLWQGAYSELFVADVLWPDFEPEHLRRFLVAFAKRSRRFGGLEIA